MSAQLNQQKTPLATTSLSESAYRLDPVYIDPDVINFRKSHLLEQAAAFVQGSYYRSVQIRPQYDLDMTVVFSHHGANMVAQEHIRAVAERLCQEHPAISTYEGIFGGIPHLKGLRLSVADILEQLYLTGSIDAVHNIYSPDVSEDQIKEAIAYAQDFLESAFSS
jgi:uncharacterized protein (DUF433 family)